MSDHFASRGGVRWRFTRAGAGPLALLVHGAGASSHSFFALAARLAPRFEVVVPDLPGHAASRPEPGFIPSLPGIASALGELSRELGRPALAVGHSSGAAVLARMTLDGAIAPARLAFVAPALAPLEGAAAVALPFAAKLFARSRVFSHVLAARASAVERMIAEMGSTLDAAGLEAYRALAERPGHVRGVLDMLAAWDVRPLWSELPRLRDACELVMIAGARDRAIPLADQRRTAAQLGVELTILARAGHLAHEERPDEVEQRILSEMK